MLLSSAHNDVKVYNVSAGKTTPQWMEMAKKGSLRHNEDFRRRIELIQDLDFPTTSQCLVQSEDREFLLATGVYPPQLKVFELRQLTMKFERHVDAEVVKALLLESDWRKIALLEADRSIELHSQAGAYFKLRIPTFGRDMVFNPYNCDLCVAASNSEVYRVNLDQGRFLQPFDTMSPANNVCAFQKEHQILSLGGTTGLVECIDARARQRVGVLNVQAAIRTEIHDLSAEVAVTALAVNHLSMAVGTSSGHVLMYDVRSSKPLLIKDHQYEFPINTIKYHGATDQIISADTKIVKIWDQNTGKTYTSIEPGADINSMMLFKDSGLMSLACEEPRIGVYFIPSLGPAPHWASFLDSLTEELEEDTQPTIYDDYKFLTRQEIETLNLTHLLGTPMLKAYMHGFFIDQRLYNRVKDIADPFAYQRWRKEEIQRKIEAKRGSRIAVKKKLPKVNAKYAETLIEKRAKGKLGEVTEDVVDSVNPTGDDRFGQMFQDKDFEIDPTSDEFRLRNPVAKGTRKQVYDSDEEKEEGALENFARIFEDRSGSESTSSDDDESGKCYKCGEKGHIARRCPQANAKKDEEGEAEGEGAVPGRKRKVQMYEAENGLAALDPTDRKKRKREKQALGKRVAKLPQDVQNDRRVGNFQATIAIKEKKSERRLKEEEHAREAKLRERRGVGELGLKNPVPQFNWKRRGGK